MDQLVICKGQVWKENLGFCRRLIVIDLPDILTVRCEVQTAGREIHIPLWLLLRNYTLVGMIVYNGDHNPIQLEPMTVV